MFLIKNMCNWFLEPAGGGGGGGVFQRGHTQKIGFLRVIFGATPWNSCFFRPKNKFRKLPSTHLYGKKCNSPFSDKA